MYPKYMMSLLFKWQCILELLFDMWDFLLWESVQQVDSPVGLYNLFDVYQEFKL